MNDTWEARNWKRGNGREVLTGNFEHLADQYAYALWAEDEVEWQGFYRQVLDSATPAYRVASLIRAVR